MDWILFFNKFLTNKEIFFDFCDKIPNGIFKNAAQTNLLILIRKFAEKYKRVPDFDTVEMLLENLPDGEKDNKKSYIDIINKIRNVKSTVDLEVFTETVTNAIQTYDIEQFLIKSADNIGKFTPDDMMGEMRTLVTKYIPKNMGVDVTDVDRAIKIIRQDHSDKTSTGVMELDRALYGGYGNDEIFILLAPPNKGKSYFLLNAMYYAMLAGKNVLYITLELSERAVLRRFYSRVAYANKAELRDELVIAKLTKKFFSLSGSIGRIMYQPGASLTVSSLESILGQNEMYFNFKPDVLIVDYLDRLAPRKSDYKEDKRDKLRNITEDLRSISLRHSIPVLTASQANRKTLNNKITPGMEHMSESMGKNETADVVVALCQNDEEKLAKKARLIVAKNRDNVSGGKISFYCDFDKMFLSDTATATRLGLVEKVELEREIK